MNDRGLPHSQIPAVAKWLGALGAMPFVLFALAGLFWESPAQQHVHFALAAYGSVILSFLGGIHWGLAIADTDTGRGNVSRAVQLGLSVVPPLVGWGALLITGPSGLLVMAAAFFGMLLFDQHASQKGEVPTWYLKLRPPLTAVVVISLTLAALV